RRGVRSRLFRKRTMKKCSLCVVLLALLTVTGPAQDIEPRATLRGHSDTVWTVAISPDGKLLASGSKDKTVKVWDVKTQKVLLTLTGHTGDAGSLAFSPTDRNVLASGGCGDRSVKLWDIRTGKCTATLAGHTKDIYCLAFSPDGKTVVSGSEDKSIKLWDLA